MAASPSLRSGPRPCLRPQSPAPASTKHAGTGNEIYYGFVVLSHRIKVNLCPKLLAERVFQVQAPLRVRDWQNLANSIHLAFDEECNHHHGAFAGRHHTVSQVVAGGPIYMLIL